ADRRLASEHAAAVRAHRRAARRPVRRHRAPDAPLPAGGTAGQPPGAGRRAHRRRVDRHRWPGRERRAPVAVQRGADRRRTGPAGSHRRADRTGRGAARQPGDVSARSDAALAAVPAGPRVVRVYLRHCFIPAVGKPDPLWVNPAVDSRWWTPRGSLYVAEEPDTVMAEHCRNSAAGVQAADPTGGVGLNERNFAYYAGQPVGDPLPARALFAVAVAFARLADLRSPLALDALRDVGVSAADLLADDYGPCPAIAQAGERLGWQALRAQSAA